MTRAELKGGDWVDLVDRLNHAQQRRIRAAAAGQDRVEAGVAAMVTGWALRDVAGAAIPFPADQRGADGIPLAALDLIPGDVFDEISVVAARIVAGGPAPNAGPATSGESPREPASESTPISPISTSSKTIPAGPGTTSSEPQPT